jgi:hypothetical protein
MKTHSMAVTALAAFALSGLTIGPVQAEEDHERGRTSSISKVNSSIELRDGEQADQLETVNGSIRVGDNAAFSSAETVNGSIRVGDGSKADWLETVNGRISLGSRTTVARSITTVNGRLELASDAVVRGDIRNVNSKISVGPRAIVGGRIVTHTGSITLEDNARVGGILVKYDSRWWSLFGDLFDGGRDRQVVTIGPGVEVAGDMVFEREVELRVHSTAKIGNVKGATVKKY